jgi:hypothetical protein
MHLNDISESIVGAAGRGHAAIMCQTQPMRNLVAKAVVAQGTALH